MPVHLTAVNILKKLSHELKNNQEAIVFCHFDFSCTKVVGILLSGIKTSKLLKTVSVQEGF